MRQFYKILEVEESSTQEEIKKSYRRLSKKWHPDKHQDIAKKVEAEIRQRAISEAYSILGKKEKRILYDQSGITCPMDKIEEMAKQAILEIFKQMMKINFDKDKIFIAAQGIVADTIEALSEDKKKTDERIDLLQTVMAEKTKKSREILMRAISEEIIELQSEISKVDTKIAIHVKTLEILEKDYEKEEEMFTIRAQSNFEQWGSGSTSTY